jgi:hypothetical protein
MGELADRVDGMRIRVSTPDGGLTAELHDRDQLSLTFRDGLYRLFDHEADLERRLSTLATLLWVARTREYARIYSDVTGDDSTGEDKPMGVRDVEWRVEREDLEATGSSSDGRIAVRVKGMREWRVTIRAGTLRALDEKQFVAAVGEAAGGLIRDQFAKLVALSNKYYG